MRNHHTFNTPKVDRLVQCPFCEYDLRGMIEAQRCPECGFEYDASTFALPVHPFRTGRMRFVVLYAGPTMVAVGVITSHAADGLSVIVMFAAVIIITFGILIVRELQRLLRGLRSPATTALLVDHRGLRLLMGGEEVDAHHWTDLHDAGMFQVGRNRHRIWATVANPDGRRRRSVLEVWYRDEPRRAAEIRKRLRRYFWQARDDVD